MWFKKKSLRRQAVAEETLPTKSVLGRLGKRGRHLLLGTIVFFAAVLAIGLFPMSSGQWPLWLESERILGAGLLAAMLTTIGVLLIGSRRRPESYCEQGGTGRDCPHPWVPPLLVLITLAVAKAVVVAGLGPWIYLLGLGPMFLIAIILTIAYDQRFAASLAALSAMLLTITIGQTMGFLLTAFAGAAVLVFALRQIRTRPQLMRAGLFAAAAAAVTIVGYGLLGGPLPHTAPTTLPWAGSSFDPPALFRNAALAGGAALAAIFATLGILPLIENIFGDPTAMTLLELSDTNRPLLRRLAMEAPGTFNHSLILGTLAEAAAHDIGANALLCRVGAYYHDIGKLLKPTYFIENAAGRANRHENLSPAMSLLIVLGHVKDGLELAREYHLPAAVRKCIPEHHGTTVVECFFHAAREKQADSADPGTPVRDSEFRYPGPKPRSRETAILMICDGAESSVRALGDPTAARIEGAVHQLIMKRLLDGQFDECNLAMGDLERIEQCLVRTLAGVYHTRTAYPAAAPISKPA